MNSELKRLAEAAISPQGCVTIHEELELLHKFRCACDPTEFLALIAEIERLKDDQQITNRACFLSIAENKSLQGQLNSMLDANAKLSEYPAPLRAFANEMIAAAFEGGSFEGGDIQDIAVKHGLLRIEQRSDECGEACSCREHGFPLDCYRKTSLLGVATQNAETEFVSRHVGGGYVSDA
ncbi:hypothetical protein [Pseudomonas chlororaphis]|uniref:hypothetical protein n=1 Tax=Pseudomonas chlororaphis TaxID=587753 RepID=UPI001B311B5E|nr:hypothetical protein [Pseudomonas chlororaphis]MBP5054358.1 hypothetical protein [Pseudomonas chlororaphis]MBP5137485.1 hypothetical protein [Pseudomonas chlororaphis]QTT99535.1 hypothetical protein HUT26_09700 [Pseudomonas chlororaphis]